MNNRIWRNRAAWVGMSGILAVALACSLAPADSAERGRDNPTADLVGFERAFAQAARTIAPSVVSVVSTRTVSATPFGGTDELEEFFGGRVPRFFGPQGNREYKTRGLGSGVIVDNAGHVLTNNHVVANAERLQVQLRDGSAHKAEVIGTDPKTDLAVIRIDADDLQPAELAPAGEMHVGQWVLAVGSPYGLEQTVTAGIISASGRAGIGIADYEDLIQTDAAINRGNSGGPLINLHGEVVGINTAIISGTGGNQGIGFAIPIGMASKVMDSLIDKGEVVRGWLGVWVQSLTPDLAATFEYQHDYGALVGDVVKDGPGDDAGLESGDIIMEIDGRRVDDSSDLRNRVAQTDPGTSVTLTLWRDGDRRTLDVTLGRLPDENTRVAGRPRGESTLKQLGMKLVDLTPERAEHLGVSEDVQGAIVAAVTPLGPAAQAGLEIGDIITHVQGNNVDSARDVSSLLSRADLERGVRLRVRSGDATRFVLLKAEVQ